MKSQTIQPHRKGVGFGRKAAVVALGVSLLGAAACDSLLEVELPGDITEDQLLVPQNAGLLVTSSIAEFECALDDFAVTLGGMEDAYYSGTGWGPFLPSDQHTQNNVGRALCGTVFTGTGNGYIDMQRSRRLATTAYEKIQEWGQAEVANYHALLTTAATFNGLNLAYFGDSYCNMALDQGPLMTPAQVWDQSEEWFTRAIGHAADAGAPVTSVGTDNVGLLATLGRARVRLAQGDLAGAAADAALIPYGYVAYATRGSENDKRRNSIVQRMTNDRAVTITPMYRNLTVAADGSTTQGNGVPDPRVPVEETSGTTQNSNIPLWIQTKYTAFNDPVPIAKWQEAQYILAEVAVKQGDVGKAVGHINAVRDHYGLPRYQGGSATAVMNQIIEERRREFFFEARYHGDKLRYGIPFASGIHPIHRVTYGNATCLGMPLREERTNPNF